MGFGWVPCHITAMERGTSKKVWGLVPSVEPLKRMPVKLSSSYRGDVLIGFVSLFTFNLFNLSLSPVSPSPSFSAPHLLCHSVTKTWPIILCKRLDNQQGLCLLWIFSMNYELFICEICVSLFCILLKAGGIKDCRKPAGNECIILIYRSLKRLTSATLVPSAVGVCALC